MIAVIIIALTTIWLMYWRVRQRRDGEPPLRPGALPVIGHAHLLLADTRDLWRLIQEIGKEVTKGGPFVLQIAWKKFYVIGDPISFQAITNNTSEKSELVYKYTKEFFGDSLVNSDVPTWTRHRKILNPLFGSQVIDGYVNGFNQQAKQFVGEVDKYVGKGFFDILEHLQTATLKTICLNMAGADIDKIDNIDKVGYAVAINKVERLLTERIKKFWLYSDRVYRLSDFSFECSNNIKALHKFLDKLIRQKMSSSCNKYHNVESPVSLLDLILKLEGEKFTKEEIRDEINSIIVSGYDTSFLSLTYVLLMLGSYPEVQKRLIDEIQNICGKEDVIDRKITSQCRYLKAVIKETLRIYTIVPFFTRTLSKTVETKTHKFYEGQECILLSHALHRHPVWGDDVEQFRPERWLDFTKATQTLSAYAAFGYGRRSCIGQNYGMLFMEVMLVHILQKYIIRGDHRNMSNKVEILLKPVSGHYITIERRS